MKQTIHLSGKDRDYVNERFADRIGNAFTPLALSIMKYENDKENVMHVYDIMEKLLVLGDRLNEFDFSDYDPTQMVNPNSISRYRRLFDLDFTNKRDSAIDVINSAIEHFYLTRKKEKELRKERLVVQTGVASRTAYEK